MFSALKNLFSGKGFRSNMPPVYTPVTGFLASDVEALIRRGQRVGSEGSQDVTGNVEKKELNLQSVVSKKTQEEIQSIYDAYLGRKEQVLQMRKAPGRQQTLLGSVKSLLG